MEKSSEIEKISKKKSSKHIRRDRKPENSDELPDFLGRYSHVERNKLSNNKIAEITAGKAGLKVLEFVAAKRI